MLASGLPREKMRLIMRKGFKMICLCQACDRTYDDTKEKGKGLCIGSKQNFIITVCHICFVDWFESDLSEHDWFKKVREIKDA